MLEPTSGVFEGGVDIMFYARNPPSADQIGLHRIRLAVDDPFPLLSLHVQDQAAVRPG